MRVFSALVYPFSSTVLFLCASATSVLGATGDEFGDLKHALRQPELIVSLVGALTLLIGIVIVSLELLPVRYLAIFVGAYLVSGVVATFYERRHST